MLRKWVRKIFARLNNFWNPLLMPMVLLIHKSKYKKVGVQPIRIVKSESPSSERVFLWAYARNVRLYYLYRQYTPTFLYFDLYLNTAYAAHYVYIVHCLYVHHNNTWMLGSMKFIFRVDHLYRKYDQAGAMFVFTPVVVIGFNPSTAKRFLFTQGWRPATITKRKINIIHMLNHIHGTGSGSESVIWTSVIRIWCSRFLLAQKVQSAIKFIINLVVSGMML